MLSMVTFSCTDVVDVDVPTAPPRLVVEASIDWEKGSLGNEQVILLSTSTPFFDNLSDTSVIGASVQITNTNSGETIVFTDQEDGTYTTSNFTPILNNTYTLEINYLGEIYRAEETMTSVPDIDEISQSRESGFNDEALAVDLFFRDPPDEDNFYFFRFEAQGDLLPELLTFSDEFTNGNRLEVFFEKEDDEDNNIREFAPGDVAFIEFHGVSRQNFNYLEILIDQFESAANPFGTIPASLRGNCINISNPDNYAFGYFRLSQVVRTTYVFQ
jgi:hypothetical protein